MHHIRTALRSLALRPGFTLIAIATLALGIGANAAIFSVFDAVLLRPLPFADADRLVMAWGANPEMQLKLSLDRLPFSPGDATDHMARNSTFDALASVRTDRVNLTGGGEAERIGAVRVNRNFLKALGVQPVLGRDFTDADVEAGRAVIIGHGLWQRRYGGAADVLGRPILINGIPVTVVGVMPPWFRFPANGELPAGLGYTTVPELWSLDVLSPEARTNRGGKSFSLVGRLKPGVSREAAEADLNAIAAGIARLSPSSNAGWTVRVIPLREQLVGGLRPALVALLAAVGIVLFIACVNVANLLLVRAQARQREVAVRYALGASRWQILSQLVVESLLLAVAAGAIGVVVGYWALKGLLTMLPVGAPALADAVLDWRVVTFTIAVSLATGVVFGLVPAFQSARVDLAEGLREGARGAVGSRRAHRTRNLLVILEVALAAMLLILASLLIQTFVRLLNVETGFQARGVLTMDVSLPRAVYPEQTPAEFFERLIARLSAVPGVDAVAATSSIPLAGMENLRQITIEGRPRPAPGTEIGADFRVVTADYFKAMGIPQLAGESLPVRPGPESPRVLLVNATMAEAVFAGENPIGRRLKLTAYDQDSPWYTVVGVVGDTRNTGLDRAVRPQVYLHHNVEPSAQMAVVLRTRADPSGYASVARAAVHELDPNQPVGRIRTMSNVVSDAVARQRFTMTLAGLFALLALVLSLVGLYGVVSYSVAERTHELGLRFALGATPSSLRALVVSDGLRLVGVGVILGLAGAWVLARLLETQLFGVTARDPVTFVSVPLLLIGAAIAGCLIPARRATRIDPMTAMRQQ
jgi:putative ABC transport system permease protein